MINAAKIIFCLSALAMLHTYVLYPALMLIIGSMKRKPGVLYSDPDELPEVTVICAAYNEEKVIEEKVHSTFNTTYPLNKITFLIGTDNCSDITVPLIQNLQNKYRELKLVEFTQRTGKIGILNTLIKQAKGSVLIMTDANVFFKPDTILEMVKHFKDEKIGLVCGQISKRPLNKEAVTQSELQYMNFENRLKLSESNAFGIVMGAEGGCYAIRKELIKDVPANFNVDDFFITCLALKERKNIVFEEKAISFEDVAANIKGEFRRKARIATGNFQNLFHFKGLWLRFWSATGFAFLSHKVLRWITPFLFLLNVLAVIYLFKAAMFFRVVLYVQVALILLTLLSSALSGAGIKIKPLIALSHFMIMNLALAVGFFRYLSGVKSSVWEPVKR